MPIPIRTRLAACCALLFAVTSAYAQTGQPAIVVIDDVTVIGVENSRAVPHQTVRIDGERIDRIDEIDHTEIPTGAKVISGKGLFLIPGLFDAHVHYSTS